MDEDIIITDNNSKTNKGMDSDTVSMLSTASGTSDRKYKTSFIHRDRISSLAIPMQHTAGATGGSITSSSGKDGNSMINRALANNFSSSPLYRELHRNNSLNKRHHHTNQSSIKSKDGERDKKMYRNKPRGGLPHHTTTTGIYHHANTIQIEPTPALSDKMNYSTSLVTPIREESIHSSTLEGDSGDRVVDQFNETEQRENKLHTSYRRKSLLTDTDENIEHGEDIIVTPFAQILATLQNIRSNFVALMGKGVSNEKDQHSTTSDAQSSQQDSNHANTNNNNTQHMHLANETLTELDWCLNQLETLQPYRSVSDMASNKFKKMLNEELSHLSKNDTEGSQITEYITSNFLEKEHEDDSEIHDSSNQINRAPHTIEAIHLASPPHGKKMIGQTSNEKLDDTVFKNSTITSAAENRVNLPLRKSMDQLSLQNTKQSLSSPSGSSTTSRSKHFPYARASISNTLSLMGDASKNILSAMSKSKSPKSPSKFAQQHQQALREVHWSLPTNQSPNNSRTDLNMISTTNNSKLANKIIHKNKSHDNNTVDVKQKFVNTVPQDTQSLFSKSFNVIASSIGFNPISVQIHTFAHGIPKYGVYVDDDTALSQLLSNDMNKWGLDTFKLNVLAQGRPLTSLTYTILKERKLIEAFNIPVCNLLNFLMCIEDHYLNVPYHNRIHATDVMQSAHILLSSPIFQGVFNEMEQISIIIASAIHDVDHPGFTNQFLINSCSDLAIMYNDESVLENHHLAIAFKILQEPKCNIFVNVPNKKRLAMRRLIIDLVLATDMSKHMKLLADLKTMVETKKVSGTDNSLEPAEKHKVLQSMIHCGDLSNPTKPLNLYLKWTDLIMQEYFIQGEREKQCGLQISVMCDRDKISIEKTQIGFMDYIVQPLWETWAELVYPDCQIMLQNLEENREYFENKLHERDIKRLSPSSITPPYQSLESLNKESTS